MTKVRQLLRVTVPCQYSGLHPHAVTVTTDEHGLVLGVHSDCDDIDPELHEVGTALVGTDYACCRYVAQHVLAEIREPDEERSTHAWTQAVDGQRMSRRQLRERVPPLLFMLTDTARKEAERRRCEREDIRDEVDSRRSGPKLGRLFAGWAHNRLRANLGLNNILVRVNTSLDFGRECGARRLSVHGKGGVHLADYIGRGLWGVNGAAVDWLVIETEYHYERSQRCPVCPKGPKCSLRHLQSKAHRQRVHEKFLDALTEIGDRLSSEKGPVRG